MPGRCLRHIIRLAAAWSLVLMIGAWPISGLAQAVSPLIAVGDGKSLVPASLSVGLGLPVALQPEMRSRHANFLAESPSLEARRVADWAMSSGDHAGLPFVVIDKIGARVFVFDTAGLLRGASMALLGFAHGDYTTPGIGTRKLAMIRPEERTTPAGRFVAALGHDLQADILWVDYDAAISLHRVVRGNPGDHRQERLASKSLLDKRISYGCINVPAQFYEAVVLQVFTGTSGIVYILPEQRKLEDVFPLSASEPGK